MGKKIYVVIAALLVTSQLSGCVVYDRPYGRPHYYHGWWYR